MATLYGAYATDRSQDNPTENVPANSQHGRVRVAYDSFDLTGDMSSADIIVLAKIPKGARVVGFWVKAPALSAGTLDFGWAASADAVETADPDGFLADIAVTNANAITHEAVVAEPGLGKAFSAECNITLTVDTDTSATSGTIHAAVLYVID